MTSLNVSISSDENRNNRSDVSISSDDNDSDGARDDDDDGEQNEKDINRDDEDNYDDPSPQDQIAALQHACEHFSCNGALIGALSSHPALKLIRLLILVGVPGSGKSTFCRDLLGLDDDDAAAPSYRKRRSWKKQGGGKSRAAALRSSSGWAHVSQDELGTKARCEALLGDVLSKSPGGGRGSVRRAVVDRCNHTPEQRAAWLRVARRCGLGGSEIAVVVLHPALTSSSTAAWTAECQKRVARRKNHPTLRGPAAAGIVSKFSKEFVEPSTSEGVGVVLRLTCGAAPEEEEGRNANGLGAAAEEGSCTDETEEVLGGTALSHAVLAGGTPLQELLARNGVRSFADVKRLLSAPDIGAVVKDKGGLYSAMYHQTGRTFESQGNVAKAQTLAGRVVDHCRGVIYEKGSNRLVCHALDKFWDWDHPLAATGAMDWASASATVKEDGMVVKVFRYGGAWRVASNSCIDACDAPVPGTALTVGSMFADAAHAAGLLSGATRPPAAATVHWGAVKAGPSNAAAERADPGDCDSDISGPSDNDDDDAHDCLEAVVPSHSQRLKCRPGAKGVKGAKAAASTMTAWPLSCLDPAFSYIFEVCHPLGRVVVAHSHPRLSLLLARDARTGREVQASDAAAAVAARSCAAAASVQLDVPRVVLGPGSCTLGACKALAARMWSQEEGLVVCDAAGRRLKVKGQDWKAVHHCPQRFDTAGFHALSFILHRRSGHIDGDGDGGCGGSAPNQALRCDAASHGEFEQRLAPVVSWLRDALDKELDGLAQVLSHCPCGDGGGGDEVTSHKKLPPALRTVSGLWSKLHLLRAKELLAASSSRLDAISKQYLFDLIADSTEGSDGGDELTNNADATELRACMRVMIEVRLDAIGRKKKVLKRRM